jgi:hypothetical protein
VLPLTFWDRVLVGSFATFLVIGLVVDWINAFGPANGGITPKNVHEWNWPPRPVFDVYWCQKNTKAARENATAVGAALDGALLTRCCVCSCCRVVRDLRSRAASEPCLDQGEWTDALRAS